jgi:multimeric flavodoxin WrbA
MKVIAFNGSPNANGVVAKGIEIIGAELRKEGIDIEIIHVGKERIRGCIDCRKCRETNPCRCVFDDDPVNKCRDALNAADGVILGSPVYYGNIAGSFKCFLDRLFFPGVNLQFKPAATVVSLRRSGGIATFHALNNYLTLSGAVITPSMYWDVIHGNTVDELMQDEEGMQIMQAQGRNMAWLLKTFATSTLSPPEALERKRTNFIH